MPPGHSEPSWGTCSRVYPIQGKPAHPHASVLHGDQRALFQVVAAGPEHREHQRGESFPLEPLDPDPNERRPDCACQRHESVKIGIECDDGPILLTSTFEDRGVLSRSRGRSRRYGSRRFPRVANARRPSEATLGPEGASSAGRQGRDSIVGTSGGEGQGLPDVLVVKLGIFSLQFLAVRIGCDGLQDRRTVICRSRMQARR